MHPSAGNCPVLNWIIPYELSWVHFLTSVCGNSLKLNRIVRGLMDDNYVLEFLFECRCHGNTLTAVIRRHAHQFACARVRTMRPGCDA